LDKVFRYLETLKQEGEIGLFELQFAKFITGFEPNPTKNLLYISTIAVHDQLAGNICTDLKQIKNSTLAKRLGIHSIELDSLTKELQNFECVGGSGDYKPFILDKEKLYLHKYWTFENELIQWLKSRTLQLPSSMPQDKFEFIHSMFNSEEEVNFQKVAVFLSILRSFVIISGGPGTGKTFTVNKIITALKHKEEDLKIALAAPTGKAAERLSDSIDQDLISHDPSTLHKLLGARKNGEFKFNKENKLPFDVVIVDEASMLDIRLWLGLIRAIKDSTKLILLGDKDQLASVEAGSILGDICYQTDNGFSGGTFEALKNLESEIPASSSRNLLNNNIVLLEKSYRTDSKSGIQELGKAINDQDPMKVFELISQFDQIDIKQPTSILLSSLIDDYASEIYSKNDERQFLCSNKKGILGTEELNKRVERNIKSRFGFFSNDEWYNGRRIIITKNDFSTGLRNGEIGTCFKNDQNEFYIRFGSSAQIPVAQLKYYDLAYAITVHKSQGSEFKNVTLFLPEKLNPVLTKELLYTGVTRARESTLVIGKRELISEIIQLKIKRFSSIPQKLVS
tara:strand:- start:4224 stop:5924 length:1701 start_codon:yes stop_codon:yes gene_type:complete